MMRLALVLLAAATGFWPAPAALAAVDGRATGWWTDRQGHNHYGASPEPDSSGAWQTWTRSTVDASAPALSPSAQAYNEGNALWRASRYAEAASRYERALKLAPEDVDAWNNLGACYYMLGRHDDARQAYARALALNPAHEQALMGQEVLRSYLAQREEYKRQQQAVRLSKEAWDSGRSAFERKDYARAAAAFRRCAELDPSDSAAFINLAVCLDLTGDLAATLAAYEDALRRFPNVARVRELFAKSLALNSPVLSRAADPIRLRQAEALFRRGKELGFTNLNYQDALLGNLERQRNVSVALGDRAWTEEAARKLVEAAPRAPMYRAFLGEALMAKGALEAGKTVFARAAQDFPGNTAVPLWFSKALIGVGDYDGALDALSDVLRMTPEDQHGERAATYVLMGRCCQMKGDGGGVVAAAEKAVTAAPEDPFVHAMAACLLKEGGFDDKAKEAFIHALQMLPPEALERDKVIQGEGWGRSLQEAALGETLVEAIRARDVIAREFLPQQRESVRASVERGDLEGAVRGFETVRKLELDPERVRVLEDGVRRLERAEVGSRLDGLIAGIRQVRDASPPAGAGTGAPARGVMDEAIAAKIHGSMARLGSLEASKEQSAMVFDTPSRLRGPLTPGVYVPTVGPAGPVGSQEPQVPERLRSPRIDYLETRRNAAKQKRTELEKKVKELESRPATTPQARAEAKAAASQLEQTRTVEQTCNVLIEQELIDAMEKEEKNREAGTGGGRRGHE